MFFLFLQCRSVSRDLPLCSSQLLILLLDDICNTRTEMALSQHVHYVVVEEFLALSSWTFHYTVLFILESRNSLFKYTPEMTNLTMKVIVFTKYWLPREIVIGLQPMCHESHILKLTNTNVLITLNRGIKVTPKSARSSTLLLAHYS